MFLTLTILAAISAGPFFTDYADAYRDAERRQTLLLIDFGSSAEFDRTPELREGWTVVRLPADSPMLAEEPFQGLDVRGGLVVFDFRTPAKALQFWLPGRYSSTADAQILLTLKAGTPTQRALAWAVRRSGRPSADGHPAEDLLAHAERHSGVLAASGGLFHNLPGNASGEICAMCFGDSIHEAAVNAVAGWSTSAGHNQLMSSSWNAFGYDMTRRGGYWYAVGVFR